MDKIRVAVFALAAACFISAGWAQQEQSSKSAAAPASADGAQVHQTSQSGDLAKKSVPELAAERDKVRAQMQELRAEMEKIVPPPSPKPRSIRTSDSQAAGQAADASKTSGVPAAADATQPSGDLKVADDPNARAAYYAAAEAKLDPGDRQKLENLRSQLSSLSVRDMDLTVTIDNKALESRLSQEREQQRNQQMIERSTQQQIRQQEQQQQLLRQQRQSATPKIPH